MCLLSLLTIYKVIEASYQQILTTALGFSSVGIEVNMTDGFPSSEPTNDQTFSVGMNDVNIICIVFV